MGKHFHEVMNWSGPEGYVTGRQFRAWTEWLRLQWNEPNRSDQYVMKLIQTLVAVNMEKGKTVPPLESFRIPYEWKVPGAPVDPEEVERTTAASKGGWLAMNEMKPTVRWVDKDGNPCDPPTPTEDGGEELT